jgi:hypothetical protein
MDTTLLCEQSAHLRQDNIARVAAIDCSSHSCVRAEKCQSTTKPCNTAILRQRYCRIRPHLEAFPLRYERSGT